MRGQRSKVGDTRTSPNGYHYTKTSDRGWIGTHRLVAEKKIGRLLEKNERIRFLDNDRSNRNPSNLQVYVVKEKSANKKRAHLETKIAELQAELEELDED
jgi:hypothetical protein